jgi:hydroxymethylpyrimidine pyrophosphatase-like HAD family hydrolase
VPDTASPVVDLVVTDLDGTLWHTDDEIHPDTVAAVAELRRRNVPLLVATGRRVGSTRRPLARMGMAPPAVVLNGALALDLATDERFHRAPFPADEAAAVLAAFAAAGLSPCIYVDRGPVEVLVGDEPSTNPGHLRDLGDTAATADLTTVVSETPVLAFSLIGVPHGPLVAAAEAVGDGSEVHLDRALDYPGYASMTVAPRGQSKWDGVEAYCRRAGLDPARVLAIGDGPNDVELLTGAAVAVVPENGHPAALALADHTVPPPGDGGWSALLDLL